MSPWQKKLCELHGEKLLIFCKEDGKFICQHCAQSLEHSGHQIFFMEKVAKDCQVGPKEKVDVAENYLKWLLHFLKLFSSLCHRRAELCDLFPYPCLASEI